MQPKKFMIIYTFPENIEAFLWKRVLTHILTNFLLIKSKYKLSTRKV